MERRSPLPFLHKLHNVASSSSFSNIEQDTLDIYEAIWLQNPFSFLCFYSRYFIVLPLIPNMNSIKKKKWRHFFESFQSIRFSFCRNNSSFFVYTLISLVNILSVYMLNWLVYGWINEMTSLQFMCITGLNKFGPEHSWFLLNMYLNGWKQKKGPSREEATHCRGHKVSVFHQETKVHWLIQKTG